jgi:hypothetical protein
VTVVVRRIASVPRRTSVESWHRIIELLTAPESDARGELASITDAAAMLIAEEFAKGTPITVAGGGPLVRIYTLHGTDAIEHDLDDETELAFDPTAGDSWKLTLPAEDVDVEIARAAVASSRHVEVRDIAELAQAARSAAAAAPVTIPAFVLDLKELERP